jgi:hypothetical protein
VASLPLPGSPWLTMMPNRTGPYPAMATPTSGDGIQAPGHSHMQQPNTLTNLDQFSLHPSQQQSLTRPANLSQPLPSLPDPRFLTPQAAAAHPSPQIHTALAASANPTGLKGQYRNTPSTSAMQERGVVGAHPGIDQVSVEAAGSLLETRMSANVLSGLKEGALIGIGDPQPSYCPRVGEVRHMIGHSY